MDRILTPDPPRPSGQATPATETPAVLPAAVSTKVSISNPAVVRSAFGAAGLSALALLVPLPGALQVLWLPIVLFGGGFLSVYLFRRRTGVLPGGRGGTYLGWLTGFFCYLIELVVFTLNLIVVAAISDVGTVLRQVMEQRGSPETMAQLEQVLSSPGGIGMMIFLVLFVLFLLLPILAMAGGAIGARVLNPD